MAKIPARPQPIAPVRSAQPAPLEPSPGVSAAPEPVEIVSATSPISVESAILSEPVAPPEPTQTAEVVQARTRYGFPVYVPTQKKLLAPNEIYPLILDSWVRNQLEQERGALVRAKL